MIVFGTWVLNYDRYGPSGCRVNMDNVFFSTETEGGMVELRVMDHSPCFTNGAELTKRVQQIGMIKDERIFGLFPESRELLNREAVQAMCEQMATLGLDVIENIVQMIPSAWSVSNEAKQSLIQFISQRLNLTSVEHLQKFIHTRGNQIQLTEPRFVKVMEACKDQLDRLFEELVGIESKSERVNLGAKLKQRFEKAGITDRLKTDVSLRVPVLEREIRVPYGYQNGKFHLLQPVRFKALSVDSNVNLACVYSLEGQSLHNYHDSELGELKLNVIGSFRGEGREAISDVRRVLASNDVKLWTEGDLPALFDEIRRNGKKILE